MNEPSVFSEKELAMPLDNLHYKADGTLVKHRDLHNMYGALQMKATYDGLIQRSPTKRPFVLTRSYFFGS